MDATFRTNRGSAHGRRTLDWGAGGRVPGWVGYAVALIATVALTGILDLLHPIFPRVVLISFYVLNTMGIAFYFGAGPAVLSVILFLLGQAYVYVEPEGRLWPLAGSPGELTRLLVVLATGVAAGSAMVALRRLTRGLRAEVREHEHAEEELARSEARFLATLRSTEDEVWIVDRDARVVLISDSVREHLGIGSERLPNVYAAIEQLEILSPDGSPRPGEDAILLRALRGEVITGEEEMVRNLSTGELRWREVSAAPVCEADGRLMGAVAVARDITDRKRVEDELARERERLAAIYSIAEVGITARDLQDALETIAVRIREVLHSHSCSIFTYEEDTHEFLGRAACNVPGLVGSRLAADRGLAAMIHGEREPIYVADAEHDPRVQDPSMIEHHMKALLVVPLVARGRLIGMARVDECREREFTEEEVVILESMASRAALIIDNAQLVDNLANNYLLLQRALLPPSPPEIPGYRIAAAYMPGARGAEIGGDFYDVFLTEAEHLGVIIGDVTGKGIPSASLATDTRSTLRAFAYDTSRPGESLSHTNSVICNELQDVSLFVTVFACVIDHSTGRVCYANAGHPPACFWRRATGEPEFAGYGDPPVGALPSLRFEEHSIMLRPGDKVVLYTDGLSEARSEGDMFGLERIAEVVREHGHESPQDLLEALVAAGLSWAGGEFADDTAVIVIECEPAQPAG